MIRTHPLEPGMAGIDAMQLLVGACRWAADESQGVGAGPSVDDGEWWDSRHGPDGPRQTWQAAGTCLRVARARAGLSSDALGEAVGVSGQRIRQLEQGDPARPPAALVARIYGQLPWLDPAARILWAAAERRTPLGAVLDREGDDGVAVRELAARIYWDGEPDAEALQRLADAVEALGAEREGGPPAEDTAEVVTLARWSGPELAALARWLRGGGTAR
jgi:transcriptional regulator with XRE-family HTH domain